MLISLIFFKHSVNAFFEERMPLSRSNKALLKQWLKDNHERPYASELDINVLMNQTCLTAKQIRDWLTNQRKNSLCITKKNPYFSKLDKQTLMEFFNRHNHPGPDDLDYLAKLLFKDRLKIRAFFDQERFKRRRSNLNIDKSIPIEIF
jgi:hypothetical protein